MRRNKKHLILINLDEIKTRLMNGESGIMIYEDMINRPGFDISLPHFYLYLRRIKKGIEIPLADEKTKTPDIIQNQNETPKVEGKKTFGDLMKGSADDR